jgi:hypothetical protein
MTSNVHETGLPKEEAAPIRRSLGCVLRRC